MPVKIDGCPGLLDTFRRRKSESKQWQGRTQTLTSKPPLPNKNSSIHKTFSTINSNDNFFYGRHELANVRNTGAKTEKLSRKKSIFKNFGLGRKSQSVIDEVRDFNFEILDRQRTKSFIGAESSSFRKHVKNDKEEIDDLYNIKIPTDQGIGSDISLEESSTSSSKTGSADDSGVDKGSRQNSKIEKATISNRPMQIAIPKVYVPPKTHVRRRTISHEVTGVFEI